MTPQDHNKVLGVLNLVYGGVHAFGLVLGTVYVWFIMNMMRNFPPPHGSQPFPNPDFFNTILVVMTIMLGVFTLLFGVPPLIAGYGLLKRKAWARKAAIVAAFLSAVGFPLGTALSVYSFWFLFGQGESLYKDGGKATVSYLHEARPDAQAPFDDWRRSGAAKEREREYVPPPQPPDWRG